MYASALVQHHIINTNFIPLRCLRKTEKIIRGKLDLIHSHYVGSGVEMQHPRGPVQSRPVGEGRRDAGKVTRLCCK